MTEPMYEDAEEAQAAVDAFFNQRRVHLVHAQQFERQADQAFDGSTKKKFLDAAAVQRRLCAAAMSNQQAAQKALDEFIAAERSDHEELRAYGSLTVDMRGAS